MLVTRQQTPTNLMGSWDLLTKKYVFLSIFVKSSYFWSYVSASDHIILRFHSDSITKIRPKKIFRTGQLCGFLTLICRSAGLARKCGSYGVHTSNNFSATKSSVMMILVAVNSEIKQDSSNIVHIYAAEFLPKEKSRWPELIYHEETAAMYTHILSSGNQWGMRHLVIIDVCRLHDSGVCW